MSRRIVKDIEEAISREVRRITFHSDRTQTETFLQETFDPFTGEVIQTELEADYYDSSADTGHRQYPHVFVRLLKTREDRFTNRVNGAQWGKQFVCPNEESSTPLAADFAYEIVISGAGTIPSPGNTLEFSTFKVRRIQSGHILKLTDGNNKGSYKVDTVTVSTTGTHSLTVASDLVENLPEFNFNSTTRVVKFLESAAILTVEAGDVFEDSLGATFNITAVDYDNVSFTIDGITTPDSSSGSKVTRAGNIFKNAEVGPICFSVLDPSKPITKSGLQVINGSKSIDAAIPIDFFYMVRIDSKERQNHIEILNRMLEEFNPPRTALPTIIRSADSAETTLSTDVTAGGSSTLIVADNSKINISDPVYVFNDLTPSKSTDGGFEQPFEAEVIDKTGTDTIVLNKVVPDTFKVEDNTKVVTNCSFELLAFHFVDHLTKDVEGAQYWIHEFQYWVQAWVDRQGQPTEYESNIQSIKTPIEDIDGTIIISDP